MSGRIPLSSRRSCVGWSWKSSWQSLPTRQRRSRNLFSTATIQPVIVYLATVILYMRTRHKLPRSRGFNLGAFEWPVVMLALVWLICF